MNAITSFSGENRFLSNFYPCPVEYDGRVWKSSEYAYQAAKCDDPVYKEAIFACKTAGETKKLGKKCVLKANWDEIKLGIMEKILIAKFSNPEMMQKLKDTGDAELIEGNWWGDRVWGVCKGEGENHLGKLLMKIRDIA